MDKNDLQFLAYYLPQFHPIPENDKWWGKGFTEWTNVKKAKPLFKGHYQPVVPGELGYYDLLEDKDIQEKQSKLALEYGIDGFIYYQYWFGDDKFLLEKPAEKMLNNLKVEIPFCFCWANETWKGIWHGLDNPDILIEQKYLGKEDYVKYFNYLLPFFKDKRYIKVNNKPMFHIYRIQEIPDWEDFISIFNQKAIENNFEGIYFVNSSISNNQKIVNHNSIFGEIGVDVFQELRYKSPFKFQNVKLLGNLERKIFRILGITNQVGKRKKPLVFDYKKAIEIIKLKIKHKKYIPCLLPNWDNSPRSGRKSLIFKNSNPEYWSIFLKKTLSEYKKHPKNPPFIIIKSWNEWAEGNYLEPDLKFGLKWLEEVKKIKKSND